MSSEIFKQAAKKFCDTRIAKHLHDLKSQWLQLNDTHITTKLRTMRFPCTRYSIESKFELNYESRLAYPLKLACEKKSAALQTEIIEHLEFFFKRHPWLQPLQNCREFIETYLSQNPPFDFELKLTRLSMSLTKYNYLLETTYDLSLPLKRYDSYLERSHYYPFELINQYLNDSGLHSYEYASYTPNHQAKSLHQLPSLEKNLTQVSLNHYKFTRLDIYRFMSKYFYITTKSLLFKPVELAELSKLEPISKLHTEGWLINIQTAEDPYWILLHCHKRMTKLYIPEELGQNSSFNAKKDIINKTFPIGEIVSIKNTCETTYSGNLSQSCIWQYQLLGRILPYCRTDHKVPLNDYRNHPSLNHLIACVWESFLSRFPYLEIPTINDCFEEAAPFSKPLWSDLLAQKLKTTSIKYQPELPRTNPLSGNNLLKAVDQQLITILPRAHGTTLKVNVANNNFLQACFMACFLQAPRMDLILTNQSKKDMPDIPLYIFEKVLDELNYIRFEVDTQAKSVNPGDFLPLVRLSNGAACNRLMESASTLTKPDSRWDEAGRLIFELFRNNADKFETKTLRHYLEQTKIWQKTWFDPDWARKANPFKWQMAQFAQMGTLGISSFFDHLKCKHLTQWHDIYQTPTLNIPVLFDLNGDRLLSTGQYIRYLRTQLTDFIQDERCVPKFSQVHLILPNPSTVVARQETIRLIRSVSDYKYTQYKEANTFVLHDLKTLPKQEQVAWFEGLESLANQFTTPLLVMIHMPEFEESKASLKSRYKALQNKILDNQRLYHERELAKNTTLFYDGVEGSLEPMVAIRNFKHREEQPFDDNDKPILLSANTPGTQQELQQNIEANHEIMLQVEEKKIDYEEPTLQIGTYTLDVNQLITRENIQARLAPLNEAINWRQEFSHWVGSALDAAYLINYVELKALEKIREYNSSFQMSSELNHLPFGFYLACYPNNPAAYILCYDENRAKLQHHEWKKKPPERRNPFILHLKDPLAPVKFEGDFRQFSAVSDEEHIQRASWNYFNDDDSEPPSQFSIDEQLKASIAQRMQAVIGDTRKNFIESFISSMGKQQLKALWQLFYHYDSQKNKLGSQNFVHIAHAIYNHFGENHFAIWKKYVFGVSQNASELLKKSVLDALGLSLSTLKDKAPVYRNVWFKLLQAQSKQVGLVRYDRLWYAYQVLISYLDKKQLELNEKTVTHLLYSLEKFEAVTWLDRLYHCLKLTEGQFYEINAQQAILDQIDRIDWHTNGLYYAMKHNKMPYWSEELALEGFKEARQDTGYEPFWDKPIEGKAVSLQFGRFLAAKLRIHFKNFQFFAKKLKPLLNSEAIDYSIARLLLVQLTHGCEQINDWDSKTFHSVLLDLKQNNHRDIINWFNQQFKLDGEKRGESYPISLAHLPIICSVLQEHFFNCFISKSFDNQIKLLNALGKTCQYLDSQHRLRSPEGMKSLIAMTTRALAEDDYLTAMHQTPWLVEQRSWAPWNFHSDARRQRCQESLLQQLESISYSTTTYLPSYQEVAEKLALLVKTPFERLEFTRRQIISEWGIQGCDIVKKDACFRELTTPEQLRFQVQFTEQLLHQHIRENKKLIKRIIPSLVLEADLMNPQQALSALIKQFKRIDNKPHFNDLGNVLGCIIRHLKKHAPAKISLQQLSDILESLMRAEHNELTHFPTEMFMEILTQTGEKLTNACLNDLSAALEASLKIDLQLIVNTGIPQPIKTILLRMIPAGLAQDQLQMISNQFVSFAEKTLPIKYQINLAKVIQKLIETLPILDQTLIDTLLFVENDLEKRENWLKSRHHLLKKVLKADSIDRLQQLSAVLLSAQQPQPEVEIIAIQTLSKEGKELSQLIDRLKKLTPEDLAQLADYCSRPPKPSAAYLIKQLSSHSIGSLIHEFETVEQANNLRQYSVNHEDRQALKRVLGGIKEKNTGYISDDEQKQLQGFLSYVNTFAQENHLATVSSELLKASIRQTAQCLQNSDDESTRITYRLQLLAQLREVMLRQTGKWANHTQMLDLIYAALHDNKSLFHQLKTGQGKSIITLIRVASHALNGKVVDVFTAKESLSSRDHKEFGLILDAIGIEHSHIIPDSPEDEYKTGDDLFGAVNYLTPGSFSLFQSAHAWNRTSKRYINYTSRQRLAVFDEGDTLADIRSMFNYAYGGEASLYNFDTWVYQATGRYFQTIEDSLPINEHGKPYILPHVHLKGLCEYLQKCADFAPIQSTFIKTYLAPVVDKDNKDKQKAIHERNEILATLLAAAYTANHLPQNRDFCIQQVTTFLNNGISLDGRAAKVVIDNQLQEGASFSERVHQSLHNKLNYEVLLQGEQPDFFIQPDSIIVLSQNVTTIFEHYYSQVEGLSGTMGDVGERAILDARFGVKQVIKLPTHEVSQTLYKGTLFCEGQEAYDEAIINCLNNHAQMPTLVVSENDAAVKSLSQRLRGLLPPKRAEQYICDTNDSGLSEKKILPQAGKSGTIVNSSRMARGTDIKPETTEGLLVICADPAIPRFRKQSAGRQGRNGAKGILIDIVDYAKIRKEYTDFIENASHKRRLEQLLKRERQHLKKKLEKHQLRKQHLKEQLQNDQQHLRETIKNQLHLQSMQWDWLIDDEEKQEKYLITRVLQYFKQEIKIQNEQNIRSKEAVVAECSCHVIDQLMNHLGEDQRVMNKVRKDWLDCRKEIESLWQQRMVGATEDNEAVFNVFYEKAKTAWQDFARKYPEFFKEELLDQQEAILRPVKSMALFSWNEGDEALAVPAPTQEADMEEVIHFYQSWFKQVSLNVAKLPNHLQAVFYGETTQQLSDSNKFYSILIAASQHSNEKEVNILFAWLTELTSKNLTSIPLIFMTEVIKSLNEAQTAPHLNAKLKCLNQLFDHPCAQPVKTLTKKHMITLGSTTKFLTHFVSRGFITQQDAEYRRFTSFHAVPFITDWLWENWKSLSPNHFACFERFVSQDGSVAKFLTTHLSGHHWQTLLKRLTRYDESNPEDGAYLDDVRAYFQANLELLNTGHTETIHALFTLFFHYPHRRIDPKQLPNIHCLTLAGKEDNIQFIQFVAEQYMINETDIQTLANIINKAYEEDQQGAKTMHETVLPTFRKLPANIPVHLLETRLQRIADDRALNNFDLYINALTRIGTALNAFLCTKGITTPENTLPPKGAPENLLKRSQTIILQLEKGDRLMEAIELFKHLSQQSFNADICLKAYELYEADYKAVLDLLSRAEKIMTTGSYVLFSEVCFSQPKRSIKALSSIITTFENHAERFAINEQHKDRQQFDLIDKWRKSELTAHEILQKFNTLKLNHMNLDSPIVCELWENENSESFAKKIELLKEINHLKVTFNSNSLKERLNRSLLANQDNSRLKEFLQLIPNYATTIKETEFVHILEKWESNTLPIPNKDRLKAVFEAQKLANALDQSNPNWQDPTLPSFEKLFHPPQSKQREQFMHAIFHSLIACANTFKNKCWDFYQSKIISITNFQSRLAHVPEEKRAGLMGERLQAIKNLTLELSFVARPAQPDTNSKNLTQQHHHYFALFDQIEKQYTGNWANYFNINRVRKNQANDLFRNLRTRADTLNQFYTNMLNNLAQTQTDIIEHDRDHHISNKKGYSRLLNITQQLGLQVCIDIISDPGLTANIREQAKNWLVNQERTLVHTLWQRLNENHLNSYELTKQIAAYAQATLQGEIPEAAVIGCKNAIGKQQLEELPKDLRYLLTLLKGHFAATEDITQPNSTLPFATI